MSAPRISFLAVARAAALVFLASAPAHAEVFRTTVVVAKPAAMPSTLATNMAIDSNARRAMADAYLRDRLSPVLLRRRAEMVHDALAPLNSLLRDFKVLSRTDVAGDRIRVVCEADIDTADVALRLVEQGVLSFGRSAPRVLLVPAPDTSIAAFRGLQVRAADALRGAGITVLEAPPAAESTGRAAPGDAGAQLARAAVEAGAHFVALVSVTATRGQAPTSVVILDGQVQFTLRRVYDAAVLDEQAFSAREGGGSVEMALGRVLDEIGPLAARALAGSVMRALFVNGRVVDESSRSETIAIDVARRGGASGTAALLALLRERGYPAQLGASSSAPVDGVTHERVTVAGGATVEEIFLILAEARFGARNELSASIHEHGAASLGLEILDATAKPQHEPIATLALVVPTGEGSRPGGVGGPRSNDTKPLPRSAAAATPLEFEFSAAFEQAMNAGKSTGR